MKIFRVSRCQSADYVIENKTRYAVEYISIDSDGYDIDHNVDFEYFDSEKELDEFVYNYKSNQNGNKNLRQQE